VLLVCQLHDVTQTDLITYSFTEATCHMWVDQGLYILDTGSSGTSAT